MAHLHGWLIWFWGKIFFSALDFLLKILAAGPIPKHVAFIMDGNRRYARKNNKTIPQGRSDGFATIGWIMEICMRLNIKCVSCYAFSIENFKRSEEEVLSLIRLLDENLLEMCQPGRFFDKYSIRFHVIGDIKLLPDFTQTILRKAEDITQYNQCAIVNLCMPYTSRHEMTTAIESCVRNSISQQFQGPLITEKDIDSQLMTSLAESPPLDILIRTSGVKRLSDFMLWQCCEDTQLQFSSTLWPSFGLFDFIPIILDYQRKIWERQLSPRQF